MKQAWRIKDTLLTEEGLKEAKGRYIVKGEKFFHIPYTDAELIDLEKEICMMAKWNLEAVRDEVEEDVVNQPPHYGNGKNRMHRVYEGQHGPHDVHGLPRR